MPPECFVEVVDLDSLHAPGGVAGEDVVPDFLVDRHEGLSVRSHGRDQDEFRYKGHQLDPRRILGLAIDSDDTTCRRSAVIN